jgi:aldose 1-epimerase
VPDKNGQMTDVALGFSSLAGYLAATVPYYGATIGRYANRIANGEFSLNGQRYHLPKNNGNNCLHGGRHGFHHKVWDVHQPSADALELSCIAENGEEGFPGNLHVRVTFRLGRENELNISYHAVTDKTTFINLTNHTYFNLNGAGSGPITDHLFQVNADRYTPVNAELIPDGRLQEVGNTLFDLRKPTSITAALKEDDQQLRYGGGYDHNFILNKNIEKQLEHAATVTGNRSGITLKVFSTEPGLQFYSGNFMDGTNKMKAGETDLFRTGFCLETQHFPDGPNQPSFPPVLLEPEDIFTSETCWRFE